MKIFNNKVLNCGPIPDPTGDVILHNCVEVDDFIPLFENFPDPKNFITFAKTRIEEDGVYISCAEASVEKYNGMYIAPDGIVTRILNEKINGRECRIIKHVVLSSVVIVPKHVDPNIKPVIIDESKTDSQETNRKIQCKISNKSDKRRAGGIDSGSKPLGKKPVFKRRSVRRDS